MIGFNPTLESKDYSHIIAKDIIITIKRKQLTSIKTKHKQKSTTLISTQSRPSLPLDLVSISPPPNSPNLPPKLFI